MEEYVTLRIAGSTVRVPRGMPVLEAVALYGICIPHLCFLPTMTAFGACRLCLVEVEENGRRKVTASCSLDAEEGMIVYTDTPKLRKLRRNVAELLVAQTPNSKAVQDLAVKCGVKEVRYPMRNNDCTLCGRCVRVCNELWGGKAKGFVGRGGQRRVDFPFGVKPDTCLGCNDCIQVCPMTITPCAGPMKHGEEYLCGQCESQLSMNEAFADSCVKCELGKGFRCIAHGTAR
jgi:bidirectional [NiFe] hydrogenase diaphorase subunit